LRSRWIGQTHNEQETRMPFPVQFRRRSLLVSAIAIPWATGAWAQTAYPQKTVRVIVPFTAGGTSDILARVLSQKLTERLGQSFIVENKAGGGGNIGSEFVVRAPADGYTLLFSGAAPVSINQSLYKNMSFDPLKDLAPVSLLAAVPNALVVPKSTPANTIEQLVTYLKGKSGNINYGSTGNGTISHLLAFQFMKSIGVNGQHIPYKGAGVVNDVLAGRLEFMFATIPSVIGHIRAGTLKALAVSGDKRSRSLPNVPSVLEKGYPQLVGTAWMAMLAPANTPQPIVAQLNTLIEQIIPTISDQLVAEGADPVGGTPAQFGRFAQSEYERWRTVINESGAVPD
jgi:tripartite-type tricarboxylate transporter receptor subunit TctC